VPAAVWAVVVAGGSGSRFGRPKQFHVLAGRPVVEWAVTAARSVAEGVVLVLPDTRGDVSFGADVVVAGGPTRSSSVRLGLGAVPDAAEIVVVHDAARPLASEALFRAVVAPLLDDPTVTGVVCALPVADTLKRVARGAASVVETVDRSELVAVQTPQAFRLEALRAAHATGADATDDAALVEAGGGTVRVVPGERGNVKLTTPDDLVLLERLAPGER
jgi:2-C-methyl-D-erythritol 4-phosphate cytidylyltransferase